MRADQSATSLRCMTRARRTVASILCLAALPWGATACSGQSAVCDDVDSIKASVQNLKEARIGENGLTVLQTELPKIQSALTQLRADASTQYSSEIDLVQSQARVLRSSVASASADPSMGTFAKVADGIQAVGSATRDLGDAVAGSC
jgi:hypothetical protein